MAAAAPATRPPLNLLSLPIHGRDEDYISWRQIVNGRWACHGMNTGNLSNREWSTVQQVLTYAVDPSDRTTVLSAASYPDMINALNAKYMPSMQMALLQTQSELNRI